ncbi:MAG: CHAD domain-containing protein [Thermoanaerobaculia bacterium]
MREEKQPRRTARYYDTFDWRIYHDGGLLAGAGSPRDIALSWQGFDGTVRHHLSVETVPGLIRDFPVGAFRKALEPVVEMRRLLPIAELQSAATVFHLLDENEKTVVRLRLEDRSARAVDGGGESEPLPSLLRVFPLRGYGKARGRAVSFLAELGFEEVSPDWHSVLEVGGREPGAYSSKPRLELDPEMPAAEAARHIHRTLLETMRSNEDGVRQDLDSEFLHDFRVSVRRTRSALGQIKGVFPATALGYFKRELAWLGMLTGPARDLDVYLLKIDDYEALLPTAVRKDLEPLRDFLAARQRREQRKLVAGLDGNRYRRLLADWQAFLGGEADGAWSGGAAKDDPPPNCRRPIVEIAGKRIWKVYRRVLEKGRMIDDDSPDESLHRLRIECKKLRYLMEFFRSLYAHTDVGRLIKALKDLQDNLGDFNDYSVQQEQLRDFARRMLAEGMADADISMAMGRLVERLECGQAEERRAFHQRFSLFARRANQRRFRALFGG